MIGINDLERKGEPLAPLPVFLRRLARNAAVAAGVVAFSLALGTVGYHHYGYGELDWLDGLLNAAMILTGMGPVDKMTTTGGKLFATAYALYSGVVFLTMVAVLLGPVYHRLIHHFHLSNEDDKDDDDKKEGKADEARAR